MNSSTNAGTMPKNIIVTIIFSGVFSFISTPVRLYPQWMSNSSKQDVIGVANTYRQPTRIRSIEICCHDSGRWRLFALTNDIFFVCMYTRYINNIMICNTKAFIIITAGKERNSVAVIFICEAIIE